jgi:small-conductance mechanosensitive channel
MTIRSILLPLAIVFAAVPALAEEGESWKLMLQRNYEEIQYQIDYVDGVSQNLPGMVRQTRQDLAALKKKLDELMVLGRATGGNPKELRAVLAGLELLQARVDAVTMPFTKADADLKRFQDRLTELETEFAKQAAEGPSPEIAKALGDFLGDLKKLKGKLGRVKTVLDQGLGPTRDLKAGIGRSAEAVSERIPRAWRDYYLNPGKALLTVGAWQEAVQRLGDMGKFLSVYSSLFEGDGPRLRDVLTRFFGFMLVMGALCALALRRLRSWLPDAGVFGPARALAWIAGGAGIMFATSGEAFVLMRAETSALGEVLIGRGAFGLAWFLRRRQLGARAPARNPAGAAWWMFALAVMMQMPWLPDAPRAAVWIAALLVAGWLIRRGGAGTDDTAVSRLSRLAGWLYPALCLPALFGFVNLTLLTVIGWFLLLIFLQAGLALYGLVGRVLENPPAGLIPQAAWSAVGALTLPMTVIASAGGFLFWLCLSMGGSRLFWAMLGSDVEGEGLSLDLGRAAVIFIGFYMARAAVRVADRLIEEIPAKRPDLERGVLNLLETLSVYLIWGVYALCALRLVGASFTSLAVVAGGLSVGIGFGMQNIINNFISGLILLFGRSVQAGDVLQIGDMQGVVQRVNIRNTVVQTGDNATVFVPNSDLIAQRIVNWSHKDRRVRRSLEVGAAPGSNPSKAMELLVRAAREHPLVLAEPKPMAQFTAFGETALRFKLQYWVADLDHAGRASSDIHLAVDRLFKENGVDIAFPQRDSQPVQPVQAAQAPAPATGAGREGAKE